MMWSSGASLRAVAGMSLAWLVAVSAASIAALLSNSAAIAQVCGGLAAALGASVVVAWWNPRLRLAGGATSVTMLVLGGCLINAVFFDEMPEKSALLIVIAMLVPMLADLSAFKDLAAWKRVLVRVALAAIPAASAVVLAKMASPDVNY